MLSKCARIQLPRVEVLPETRLIQVEIMDQIDKEHEEWEEDCSINEEWHTGRSGLWF